MNIDQKVAQYQKQFPDATAAELEHHRQRLEDEAKALNEPAIRAGFKPISFKWQEGEIVCEECGGREHRRWIANWGQPTFCTACIEALFHPDDEEAVPAMRSTEDILALVGVPKQWRSKGIEDWDRRRHPAAPKMLEAALVLVEGRGPPWLAFCGPVGTGKTMLASVIARCMVEQRRAVWFRTAGDLLDEMRATFDRGERLAAAGAAEERLTHEELLHLARTVDVLILDDLGAQHASAWGWATLLGILNHRYGEELTTVITTNLAAAELERLDGRLYSRLTDGAVCRIVAVTGPDQRPRNRWPGS